MPVLSAPYNFVPLSKKVVRPFWAHQISHDKPFSDGQSGTLQLTIEAKTPIFTRNNVSRRETDDDMRKELGSHFSKYSDRYFIPGSSIKGSIRNVLEILSFGDFGVGLIAKPYAMRDLTLDNYKELFSNAAGERVYCGWLKKEGNDDFFIEDCGIPVRISHQEIDRNYGSPIMANWVAQFEFKAHDKIKRFNINSGQASKKRALFNRQTTKREFQLGDGSKVTGTLVLTGQPAVKFDKTSKRGTINVNQGESIKYKEFIFREVQEKKLLDNAVVEAFQFAYGSLTGKKNVNEPVFFHKNDQGEVASFGLAYMYKIPFKFSVQSRVEQWQKASEYPDLAECIFGHLRNDSLKGRVVIEHAWAEGNPTPLSVARQVLNSPKPTYYPTYVKQTVDGKGKVSSYKTFFDKDAVPAGWKRYPVHSDGVKNNPGPKDPRTGEYNKKIQTDFCPLPGGTVFKTLVHFHNLRFVELGALLSAISFHETEGCFHTIGMAKPLGYGQCSIAVSGIDETLKIEALRAFENYMEGELKVYGGWAKSAAIKELLTMSSLQDNSDDRSRLEYMKDVKDFAAAKREGLALDLYSKLPKIKGAQLTNKCDNIETTANENVSITDPIEALQLQFEKLKKEKIQAIAGKLEKIKQEKAEKEKAETAEGLERLRKEATAKNAEEERQRILKTGIPVNGILDNKTMAGTARAIGYWLKNGGNIQSGEMSRISSKLQEIHQSFKNEKKRAAWLEQCKKEISLLKDVLNSDQLMQIENLLNDFIKS